MAIFHCYVSSPEGTPLAYHVCTISHPSSGQTWMAGHWPSESHRRAARVLLAVSDEYHQVRVRDRKSSYNCLIIIHKKKMLMYILYYIYTWMCLKMVSTPKANGFADHYPYEKWLFHWEYTQHFQTNPYMWMIRSISSIFTQRPHICIGSASCRLQVVLIS